MIDTILLSIIAICSVMMLARSLFYDFLNRVAIKARLLDKYSGRQKLNIEPK